MTSATPADVADAEDDGARRAQPELAAEVRALAARIAKVFSGESPPPVTDARLREVEDLHKAVSALNDAARRGRNAVFRQAIAQRWTFERPGHGTEHGTHRTASASTPAEGTTGANRPTSTRASIVPVAKRGTYAAPSRPLQRRVTIQPRRCDGASHDRPVGPTSL